MERFSQASMLDLKACGVAALTASVGASFQRRIADRKNEDFITLDLHEGTRNFWSWPLSCRRAGVNQGRSGVASTSPLTILYIIKDLADLRRRQSGSSSSRETSLEALEVGRKSRRILLAERRCTISRLSLKYCWGGSQTEDEYSRTGRTSF